MIISKRNKSLLISIFIPIGIILLALVQYYLEKYFRFSEEYKFIYGYGSTFRFFAQLALIFLGLTRGLYLLLKTNSGISKNEQLLSLLISLSPILYLLISLASIFF